jgi:hypothetical protein
MLLHLISSNLLSCPFMCSNSNNDLRSRSELTEHLAERLLFLVPPLLFLLLQLVQFTGDGLVFGHELECSGKVRLRVIFFLFNHIRKAATI